MDNIESRVYATIAEVLVVDQDQLTTETHFREDLDADSLDLIELIMALEKEFKGEIPDSDAQEIMTVGQVITYIKTKM